MRRLGFICAVVIGLGMGGCGDDDPEDQCKDLVEALCSKVAECTADAVGESGDKLKDQCISEAGDSCEGVEETKVDVDACIDAVNDISCGNFEIDSLPDGCG